MKFKKAKDYLNGAAVDHYDAAQVASQVVDNDILRQAGQDFVDAHDKFFETMKDLGIELG